MYPSQTQRQGTTLAPPPAIKVQTRPIRFNNVNFKDAPENDWISWWNPNWLARLDKFQFKKQVVWFNLFKKNKTNCGEIGWVMLFQRNF